MPLWLSESDVRAVLPMRELIDAMESALIAFSAGRVVQPVRTVMEIGDRSFFALMPAFDSEGSLLGTKLVTVLPANTAKGLLRTRPPSPSSIRQLARSLLSPTDDTL